MSCNAQWERSFIFRSLPPSIVYTELKAQREELLMNKEISLLAETSLIVPFEKRLETLNEQRKALLLEKKLISQKLANLHVEIITTQTDKDIAINGIKNDTNIMQPHGVKKMVCPCPVAECRGFVFENYTCTLCRTEICRSCHLLKNAEHECKSDDIESVKCIKKECKLCPGCGAQSQKIDGCPQVWCIVCKKAWNWNTGKIETGNIHAPDYFKFMRNNGLEIPVMVPNNECYFDLTHEFRFHRNKYPGLMREDEEKRIEEFWRSANEQCFLFEPGAKDNIDIRLKYLNNEIDKNYMKSLIYKREKSHILSFEIHEMCKSYKNDIIDIIRTAKIADTRDKIVNLLKLLDEYQKMMTSEYYKLAKCFKSKRQCPFEMIKHVWSV
jgi:hypothetical protein